MPKNRFPGFRLPLIFVWTTKGGISELVSSFHFWITIISEHDINELNKNLKNGGWKPFSMEELPCSYNTQMKNWYGLIQSIEWSMVIQFQIRQKNGWARKDW